MPHPILSALRFAVVAAAVATLGGCVTDNVAANTAPGAAAPPAAAVASAEPAPAPGRRAATGRRQPAAPVAEEPAEPLTEQQASAQCWMHYENGRRNVDLDAKAKLVDQCIEAKMHGQAVR